MPPLLSAPSTRAVKRIWKRQPASNGSGAGVRLTSETVTREVPSPRGRAYAVTRDVEAVEVRSLGARRLARPLAQRPSSRSSAANRARSDTGLRSHQRRVWCCGSPDPEASSPCAPSVRIVTCFWRYRPPSNLHVRDAIRAAPRRRSSVRPHSGRYAFAVERSKSLSSEAADGPPLRDALNGGRGMLSEDLLSAPAWHFFGG